MCVYIYVYDTCVGVLTEVSGEGIASGDPTPSPCLCNYLSSLTALVSCLLWCKKPNSKPLEEQDALLAVEQHEAEKGPLEDILPASPVSSELK